MIVNQVGIKHIPPADLARRLVGLYDRRVESGLEEPFASNPLITAMRRQVLNQALENFLREDYEGCAVASSAGTMLWNAERAVGFSVTYRDGQAFTLELLYFKILGAFGAGPDELPGTVTGVIDDLVLEEPPESQDNIRFDLVCDVLGIPEDDRGWVFDVCKDGANIATVWKNPKKYRK